MPPQRNPSPTKAQPHSSEHYGHDQVAKPSTSTSIPIPDRGHSNASTDRMDPFEVRIRFTQYLQHLNASVTSANKTAQYALKYRDMDEDLHSCILEQLEKNSMNNRANIMYFIEHLCDASKNQHEDYIRMMERDILRVVDAVAPEDGSGAANIKVVRKVLLALQSKSFLLAQTVSEIEELLKERDTMVEESPVEMLDKKLDKKQVEQRIEEDRERHKRLREHIWAQREGGIEGEFERLWEETSELGEDDFILYEEEAAERNAAAKEWREEYGAKVKGSANE